jgi:hypothetical protein
MLLTNVTLVYAQELKPNSTVKTKHSSFKIAAITNGRVFVENETNQLRNQKPNQRYQLSILKAFNLEKAFKQVFDNARLNQLTNEPNIVIKYYISPKGKVLQASFILKQNTSITSTEIDELEAAIKDQVYFQVQNDKITGTEFFNLMQNVNFSKIIDGTLEKP